MADGEPTAQTTKPKNKGIWKRKSLARRQRDAREWLERLVPPERITADRVEELAEVVDRYRPGTKYQFIADAMVKNNEVPTIEKVAARYESRKNAWLRRNAKTSSVDISPAAVDQLVGMIRTSWTRHGHGPTWSEIRAAMDWDRAQTRHALTKLRDDGLIAFTTDTGSLALTGEAVRGTTDARKSA